MSDNYNHERLKDLDVKTKDKLIKKYQDEIVRIEKYLKEKGKL